MNGVVEMHRPVLAGVRSEGILAGRARVPVPAFYVSQTSLHELPVGFLAHMEHVDPFDVDLIALEDSFADS